MTTTKKITISDVAKHANISKSTVSQYLNERYEYMGAQTKQRIHESIIELGYSPNYLARSLKQKKTFTIGIIVANILHGFSTKVIRAIEDACNEENIHTIVCNTDEDPEKEQKYMEMLQAKQVDGFIVFPAGENAKVYQRMLEQKIPLVFIDRIMPDLKIDTVLMDNERASELAVENFAKHGHEKLAIATPELKPYMTPRLERLSGFKKALQTNNLPVKEDYLISENLDSLQERLQHMFAMEDPPTAILANNDLTLVEMLEFFKKSDIRLPDDISIIGIDDVPFANVYHPGITTIEQPAFKIGKKAAELLFDQINDTASEPEVYRFAPKLFERESVKTLYE
ncbi:LacI family kdg operon repressor [Salibacterium salarium]|uniref:LacI family DNA-binding transcriptional regulator n=1 Tax=Salibacterium salarium TaxID=284579 RepID=UPI0027862B70|nr:substrate-binding domain-containing protein [Salibacterium salarium]MDQ0297866.1 LacI family kdg operon repressor [Salibacterium salarium]